MSARRNPGLSLEERRASLLADIEALPARRSGKREDLIQVQGDFLDSTYGIVAEAARERRMAVASYMRRAAYAMACHDLDLPLSDAFKRDPRVTRETGFGVLDPEGVKFGDWEIESLKERDS